MSAAGAWRWLPLAVGVMLALMVYVVSYDNGGREGPCNDAASRLARSHPYAVEFRNVSEGLATPVKR